MPTVFIKPITTLCRNKNIDYYISLIVKEVKNKLPQNAIKYSESENTKCKNINGQINLFIEGNCLKTSENDIEIVFQSGNAQYKRIAEIFSDRFKSIYSNPSKIKLLSENQNNLPKVVIKFNFANSRNILFWIKENIEDISFAIIVSLDEFFGLPAVPYPQNSFGSSKTDAVILNRPNINAKIIQTVTPGEKIKILSQWEDWYIVKKENELGFVHSKFINI